MKNFRERISNIGKPRHHSIFDKFEHHPEAGHHKPPPPIHHSIGVLAQRSLTLGERLDHLKKQFDDILKQNHDNNINIKTAFNEDAKKIAEVATQLGHTRSILTNFSDKELSLTGGGVKGFFSRNKWWILGVTCFFLLILVIVLIIVFTLRKRASPTQDDPQPTI